MQLLPVALGVGGSLLGNKLSKVGTGPTGPERHVLNQDAEAQSIGLGAGREALPQANNLIRMGAAGYQPVLNYWSRILSGNRGDMTQAMAPEITRIGEGYAAANKTSAALSPRGGPSAEFLAEQPFQQQRDVTTLLQQARPQAAAGSQSAAGQATSAGSGLFNNATNAILNSTYAGRDILTQQENMKKTQADNAKAIGKGLFDMIQKYGPDVIKILQRGGGGKNPPLTGQNGPPSTDPVPGADY